MGYYSDEEVGGIGFRRVGRGVRLSKLASIYNPGAIELGDHARIDDFCVLSAGEGGIAIGRYVHVAIYCSLMGRGRIELHDFSGLSSRVAIYSSNEDYSGKSMTNPTIPDELRSVRSSAVVVREHAIVGAGSVILPGVTIGRGAGIGALSLIRKDCEDLGMYFGSPARRVGRRSAAMFALDAALRPLVA